MAKSDVENLDSELYGKPALPSDKYFCGRKYRQLRSGRLVASCSRDVGSGKYGSPTVTMRIPVELVPLIKIIMQKLEVLEKIRRNICGNILNTSPDVLLSAGLSAMIEEIEEKQEKEVK